MRTDGATDPRPAGIIELEYPTMRFIRSHYIGRDYAEGFFEFNGRLFFMRESTNYGCYEFFPGTGAIVRNVVLSFTGTGSPSSFPKLVVNDNSDDYMWILNGTSALAYSKARVGLNLASVTSESFTVDRNNYRGGFVSGGFIYLWFTNTNSTSRFSFEAYNRVSKTRTGSADFFVEGDSRYTITGTSQVNLIGNTLHVMSPRFSKSYAFVKAV